MKIKKILGTVLVLMLVLTACSNVELKKESTKNAKGTNGNVVSEYEIKDKNVVGDKHFNLYIEKEEFEIDEKVLERYYYTDETKAKYTAGVPIVVNEGDTLSFDVYNNSGVSTNIHWHGMSVPNDQDGLGILIEDGGKHSYKFKAEEAGTYWYHSHERPVRDQVDEGMYGAIIVKSKEDKNYSQDHILMLDDWLVNRNTGHMKVVGDVDVVNGLSGEEIQSIQLKYGELAKLRFINASTANVQQIKFPFKVKVTHTDGRTVSNAYMTDTIEIAPGERYDVEVQILEESNKTYTIKNDRKKGMELNIEYSYQDGDILESPFKEREYTEVLEKDQKRKEDIIMVMSDSMGMGGHKWTINGQVYEDSEGFDLELGKTYKIRFKNEGMHKSDHPMHIHGAHFRVLNINGEELQDEIWKDTVNVRPNEYVDVLLKIDKPGTWMAHCHILDHEDGGMMTHLYVK